MPFILYVVCLGSFFSLLSSVSYLLHFRLVWIIFRSIVSREPFFHRANIPTTLRWQKTVVATAVTSQQYQQQTQQQCERKNGNSIVEIFLIRLPHWSSESLKLKWKPCPIISRSDDLIFFSVVVRPAKLSQHDFPSFRSALLKKQWNKNRDNEQTPMPLNISWRNNE